MKPNIGKPLRTIYVILGILLVLVPLAGSLPTWMRITAPIIGLSALFAGGTGL